MLSHYTDIKHLVGNHLDVIYPEQDNKKLTETLLNILEIRSDKIEDHNHQNSWNQEDIWVISYGDSVYQKGHSGLSTLKLFLDNYLKPVINGVHILPFYPYSSDDGFSVIDYTKVNESLGNWQDINQIAKDYRLMADLVINHCSSRSRWFDNYRNGISPGRDYFIEVDEHTDTSAVVRPRTSPLLKPVETVNGTKWLWCTFSHDQIDLNFANPEVLCEMVRIIKIYVDQGVKIFRLDAVAFIWKQLGTNCQHLPQTHEIIRLLRTLLAQVSEDIILMTETNVPNQENLLYFGNGNEAHAIYNFSLPALVLHALYTGTSSHLKSWQMTMPPAQQGTFYFNFLASHDGIGLRPAEGILAESDIDTMVYTVQKQGGKVSWRTAPDGGQKPYELNISLFDALKSNATNDDNWQLDRYLCAHAIMLSLEGIPGIYIHSLLGTHNDQDGVIHRNSNRAINRYKWELTELEKELSNKDSSHYQVFTEIKNLLTIRRQQSAFHPNSVQFTLQLPDQLFGYWRQSIKRDQSIFCLHNVSDETITIPLSSLNLICTDNWHNLITGEKYQDIRDDLVFKPYEFKWISNK